MAKSPLQGDSCRIEGSRVLPANTRGCVNCVVADMDARVRDYRVSPTRYLHISIANGCYD
jgi:hypothetical protein